MIRYDFDSKDMLDLAAGLVVNNLLQKMEIIPLLDFDMDDIGLPIATFGDPGGYSATYAVIGGICCTITTDVNEAGEATYGWTPCPGCPCEQNSGGDVSVTSPGHNILMTDFRGYYGLDIVPAGSVAGGGPSGNGQGYESLFNPMYGSVPGSGPGIPNGNPVIGVVGPITIDTPASLFYAGLTASQKFVLLNSGEEFINSIVEFLENNNFSEEGVDQVHWVLDYIIDTGSDSDKVINWFLNVNEGQDFTYDSQYWENSNLNFPQQNLPTWTNFSTVYPEESSADIYDVVGGDVASIHAAYPVETSNGCALKVSRALNYSGITIPKIITTNGSPGTVKGGDGKYYFLNAKALNKWMRETFGTNPATTTTPLNVNHTHLTAEDGGENGINFPDLIDGKKGIFSMVSTNPAWASGHADILNEDGTCKAGCHLYDSPAAPIDYIDIWELTD